jgi:peptidoglycan-associated lipoprotein
MTQTLFMTPRTLAVAAMTALLVSACASAPEPMPEQRPVVEEVVETMPEPQARPQVIAPVTPRTTMIAPNQPIPGSLEDFAYSTGGDARIYFSYDQFTLSADARQTLRQQADWLKRYNRYTAVVEGHADERGTRQYNIALGARRANSVKAFLVSQGVDPSRLTTVSYGKERRIDARSNEDGWARNRNGYTNLRPVGRS